MGKWAEQVTRRLPGPPVRDRASGQIMIMFAFGVLTLMGFVAMAVDLGMLMNTRRNYQKIADTCVSVGAQASTPIARANTCLTTNGVTSGTTVSNPPVSGPYVGNADYVEVTINRNVGTLFMRAMGVQSLPVNVRAVAHSRRRLQFGVMGLQPGTESIKTSGTSSSMINGNACSAGDFKVSGTLNVNGYTVANGSFNGSPNSLGSESGARSAPCEDPNYPLPTIPTASPATNNTQITFNAIGSGAANCPPSGQTRVAPAGGRIQISCPAGSGTVQIPPPRSVVDVQGNNYATVELMPSGSPSGASFQDVTVQGRGQVLLAPGWYDTVNVNTNGAGIQMKPGLYMINSSYDQSGSGDLTGSNVSIVVGGEFDVTGTGVVNLSCCADTVSNNILIYHYGAALPGAPNSPWGSGSSFPGDLSLMGNNSPNRTFTGNIYSPLNRPCNSPCIQIGGNSGSMTISGQVAGPTIGMNGTGNIFSFAGTDESPTRRPALVE
jgi:hypothetical protein